ncbi:MAG TPA: PEP-CTERM sorting domain-containing protein [Terriglobales bacterium]|nr:PEP-CTERM sorting domain-containing protein [Terriglobales bacterium]
MYRSRGIRDADVSHPTEGTLTGTVNGSPQTFGLLFQSPVPEPTSLALLGTGLAAIAGRKHKMPAR